MRNIEIKKIIADDSRFSLKGVIFRADENSYNDSFERLGILNPVIVLMDGESFHLVDGEKRIRFAEQKGLSGIDAVVLPEDAPLSDVVTLLLSERREDILSSFMNRAGFVCFALSLDLPQEWLLRPLCVQLGLKPHTDTLRACERVNALPLELRLFSHEKKFSFKQLVHLASYPKELTGLISAWCPDLQLTASTMDEIASNLNGWLRTNNKSVDELMNDHEIREVLDSPAGPREKTERLRGLLRLRQFPILTKVNTKIEKAVSGLDLPAEVSIDWDRTLENRSVAMSVRINDPAKWEDVLAAISSEEVKAAIKEILDEL